MTLEQILDRLPGWRRHGGRCMASCPGPLHKRRDRHPSLSVREGSDGRILVKCFAGCTTDEICRALGIQLGDLFSERSRAAPAPGWARRPPRAKRPVWAELARAGLNEYQRHHPPGCETYDALCDQLAACRQLVLRARRAALTIADEDQRWELLARAARLESDCEAVEVELGERTTA